MPVVTATVTQRDVPVEIQAIGNVEAFETVSIRSQVTGTVTEVLFHEGDFVKKGDHLFTIDRRPYEAQLDQAKANLSRDEALLAQAEAQLTRDKAQGDYLQLTSQRNNELVERGIISKDVAQQSQAAAAANNASVKADAAAVESAKAQLLAQKAVVDNAQVMLTYTTITSPINGRTGNLSMKPGNLATANTTELVTIAGLAKSKSEAFRLIEQGGITLNDVTVRDPRALVTEAQALGNRYKVSKGRRNVAVIEIIP